METLKQYLKAEGMSQTDFARLIDDSLQNVNRYVHGRIPKTSEKINKIRNVTNGRVGYESWLKAKHEETLTRGESALTIKANKPAKHSGQINNSSMAVKVL